MKTNVTVVNVKVNCTQCEGSGVYGPVDKKGSGWVCLECEGTGAQSLNLTYTLFTERVKKESVKTVTAKPKWEDPGETITYKEFLEGKMPQFPEKEKKA